jgi:hypothetical protein
MPLLVMFIKQWYFMSYASNLGINYHHLKKKCFQFSMSSYVHIFVQGMISHYDGWDYHLTPMMQLKGEINHDPTLF